MFFWHFPLFESVHTLPWIHYEPTNARHTMLYNVMFAVHDLYVGECPPRSCIMKDQCTCPPAPGLGQVPLNSIKPSPPDICLYVINPTPPPPPSLGSYLYVKGQLDWCIYTVRTKLPILSISLNSPQKNIIKKLKNPPPLKTYSNKTMIHPRISFLFFSWTIMSWCIITRTSISLCCKGVSQSGGYGDIVGSSWGGYTHLENIGFDIAFFGS